MQNPLISVIVPIYNVEAYLDRCVESIVAQTYKNIEILLVDDGSPDSCPQICDDWAKRDERIKVVHKVNGGLSDARNAGIECAQGEYLTFIDSDDYITPDYVDTLHALCSKYNCKIAVADWLVFPEGTDPVIQKRIEKELYFSNIKALEAMFYQEHFDNSACVKLYHKSLFESGVRFPKGLLFEDLLTTFKYLLQSDGVAYTNKQIYYYMFRATSIEGSAFSEKKMDSAITVFNTMKEHEADLNVVSEALKSKLASFCFHLVLKMPDGYKGGEVLYDYIRQVRWSVLTNPRARKKARLACGASYLGMNTVKKLFALVDRRKGQ